jgi:hypothetical protein
LLQTSIPKIHLLWLIPFILINIFYVWSLSVQNQENYDQGLYYLQKIQWINQYKSFLGLANLHGRLGFYSIWFELAALMNINFLNLNEIYVLNSFIFLLTFTIVIKSLIQIINQKATVSNLFYICFFSFIPLQISNHTFGNIMNSLSPDYGAAMFCAFLVFSFIKFYEHNFSSSLKIYEISFISVSLITIKFSLLLSVLLLILILFKLYSSNNKKSIIIICCLFLGVMIVYFTHNIINSGFLVYPIYQIDIFSFSWKVPIERIVNAPSGWIISCEEEQGWIKSWARIPGWFYKDVNQKPLAEWSKVWFNNLHHDRRDFIRNLLYFFPILIILLAVYKFIKNKKEFLYLTFFFFLTIIYWFFTAPDLRFNYGFFFSFFAFFFIIVFLVIKHIIEANHKFEKLVVLILVVLVSFRIFNDSKSSVFFENKLYSFARPQRDFKFKVDSMTVKGQKIYFPLENGDRCGNALLPCTPYPHKGINLLGDKIEDGFYQKIIP